VQSPDTSPLAQRRFLCVAAGVLIALVNGACGSSVQTSTGPTPVKCQVALTTSAGVMTASGGTAIVAVQTQPECTWTAATEVAWISGLSATSGQGSGQIEVQVSANPAPAPRQGDVVVNDNRVRIEQTAAPCVFTIAPIANSVDASGDVGEVTVSTAEGCQWSATTEADWIVVSAPPSGSGSGMVRYSVAPNSGPARSGSMTIAGHIFRVTQAAGIALPPGCSYLLRPPALSLPAAGSSHAVSVVAGGGCSWSATSSVPWITITSGNAGSGDGTIGFNVAANTAGPRIGTVLVAGQVLTVSQSGAGAGGCGYAISPASGSFDAAGGPGPTVTVSTNAGCAWTASSNAPWITITTGTNGNGNGSVGFNVASNPGSARSGTLTIAGETFTVSQAGSAGCAYTINPSSQSIGASGGSATPVAVSTSPGCAWTATSGAAWISITSGGAGTGNGNVTFTVGVNTGNGRSGTLTIAGQTVTVAQAAAATCSYAISPLTQSLAAAGGPGTPIAVASGDGCSWTATSNVDWLVVNSGGSGSGNGTVNFTAAPNLAAERVGTVTIAGQTVTVTQAAAATCSYAINPVSQSMAAPGGPGTPVAVTTGDGCSWTATSSADWLTVNSGGSGSGNGTVNFTAAPNLAAERVGNLTIAGRTFTVTQSAPVLCVYQISRTNDSINAEGGPISAVAVSTAGGCVWNVVSNVPWITVTDGASGSGNGTVNLTVASNPGAARTGTVTIAGHTFTVTQAAPVCVYTIDPTRHVVNADGRGGLSITVTAPAGCAWTAVSDDPLWIIITSDSSGNGNGTVRFRVAPNILLDRTGTLTVAGHTSTVEQAGLLGLESDASSARVKLR
jgi:hypothetical protein